MSKLVVSVRTASEVETAIRGGADLIDIKEPSRGSLGRADLEAIREIVARTAGRLPVSAALGEWSERDPGTEEQIVSLGPRFVKWGYTGFHDILPDEIGARIAYLPVETKPVLVAYADWSTVDAPPISRVVEAATRWSVGTVLLDTFRKNGDSLLNWWLPGDLCLLVDTLRQKGIETALAGSLDAEQIRLLNRARPAWFAVRGAACAGGRRDGLVDEERVRHLKQILDGELKQ